ncbi:hypothetical protein OED52_01575 [Rhodococcus sp. Z13]|uniref:Uncharacterized protein n=1 Tax=Rhodococcus sacchari TaxID=2962047 RepID=A0ACD4DH20_9NOCA|nr:hypothetical protein [Rhodococcus sp. Z13]UYP19297.1 hypothetical protein OED52_01575 [Rhodococcus sp. Z13]
MNSTDIPAEQTSGSTTARNESDISGSARGRGILIVLLVLAVAAATFFGFRWWQAEQDASLRDDAVARAREYAVALGTYDYRTFDDNIAAVTANSTEEFAAEYDGIAADLRGLVESGEGTSTARAEHAGLETFDGETATVLVFLDQDVKNVVAPEGRTDATRFVVTLKRDGDRWLLDGAEAR